MTINLVVTENIVLAISVSVKGITNMRFIIPKIPAFLIFLSILLYSKFNI